MYYLILLIILVLCPSYSFAALSCGNATEDVDTLPDTSVSFSYTTPAGSNQVLVVLIAHRDATPDAVSTVTHNGKTVTKKIEIIHSSAISHASIWYRVAPDTGTNTIVVTFAAPVSTSAVTALTCNDASQDADPFRNAGNTAEAASGTAITVTAVDEIGDITLDVTSIDAQSAGPSIGEDQTAFFSGTAATEMGYGMSQQPGDGGVMSWTANSSNDWAIAAASIKPFATSRRPLKPMFFSLEWWLLMLTPRSAHAY